MALKILVFLLRNVQVQRKALQLYAGWGVDCKRWNYGELEEKENLASVTVLLQ